MVLGRFLSRGEVEIFPAGGRWGRGGIKIKIKMKVKVKVNCTASLRAWRAGLVGVGLRDTP
ncbi:hypothetical protein KQ945_07235 [Bacillus subtilis subsp. subtilis]|nr:hypothetical protein [Bacillus subtilis subsp. subtilis]